MFWVSLSSSIKIKGLDISRWSRILKLGNSLRTNSDTETSSVKSGEVETVRCTTEVTMLLPSQLHHHPACRPRASIVHKSPWTRVHWEPLSTFGISVKTIKLGNNDIHTFTDRLHFTEEKSWQVISKLTPIFPIEITWHFRIVGSSVDLMDLPLAAASTILAFWLLVSSPSCFLLHTRHRSTPTRCPTPCQVLYIM